MLSYYGYFEPLKGNESVEPIASSYARPRNEADPRKKKPGYWRCLKLGSRPSCTDNPMPPAPSQHQPINRRVWVL